MTRYEQGFMNKCAEYGVDGRRVLTALNKEAALKARAYQQLLKMLAAGKNVYTPANDAIDKLYNIGRMKPEVYENLKQVREFPRLVENLRKVLGLKPEQATFAEILRGANNRGSAMGIPQFRAHQLPRSQAVGEFLDRIGYSAGTAYYNPKAKSVLSTYFDDIDKIFPRKSSNPFLKGPGYSSPLAAAGH